MQLPRNRQSWVPLVVLALAFLIIYFLWDVLSIFILAAFFAFLLSPAVRLFERRIPSVFAIISVYLILAIILIVLIGSLSPLVSTQFQSFLKALPDYFNRIRDLSSPVQRQYLALPDRWRPFIDQILTELQSWAIRIARQAAPTLVKFFTSLLTTFFIPLLAFFMLLGRKGYKEMIVNLIPREHRTTAEDLLRCSGTALWNFVKGEIILMIVVGTLVGIGLFIIGMPYAVLFAILAGLLEVVPTVGPVATTVIITIIGFVINPWLGLKGGIVSILVQILENSLIAPSVMSRAVGLDPVTVILAVFLGGTLGGVTGVLISIPSAMFVKIVLLYFYADHDLPGSQAVCVSKGKKIRTRLMKRQR